VTESCVERIFAFAQGVPWIMCVLVYVHVCMCTCTYQERDLETALQREALILLGAPMRGSLGTNKLSAFIRFWLQAYYCFRSDALEAYIAM